MKKNILCVTALFLIVFVSNSFSQTVEKYIDDAEKFYKEFNNEKALEVLKKAEALDANNFDVLWMLSRTYVDIADKMPTSTSEQEK
ncbi:MAG: hypothetical protein Q8T08_21955, partial [Ignavibacteria bacterium]|nr:hypothetical protein [Ignavibacteria bacterium]